MTITAPAKGSDVRAEANDWVATWTVLDVSGSCSATQLRRLLESLRSAWRHMIGKRITVP